MNTIYTNFAKRVFFLLFTLIIGGGSALGATWTWTASNVNELGSNTSNAITLNGKEWTTNRSSGTNQNQLQSGCIQIGANGAAQTITLKSNAFTGKILSVAVECASFNSYHSVSISVGGTSYLSATPTPKWTTVDIKTGTGESSGEIQISFSKNNNSARALYLKSITIEYDESSIEDDEPVSSCGWVATDINNLSSTDLVVITMTNSSGTYAMSNDKGTSAAPSAKQVTVSDNILDGDIDDNIKWNVSNNNGTLTIYPNGTNAKWLYCTNTNNGVRVGTGDAKQFTLKSGYLYEDGTTDARYIGVYNSQDWRCYTSINSNIEDQTLKFYKYVPCGPTETTITLHPNGGTPNENQEITTEEESYTLPECPFSRTGYTFDGWATSADGSVVYADKATIDDLNGTAVNLYAKWTPIQYDITYNLYGGTNHASNPAKYTIETPIITLQAPTKTGYTFGRWYKEDAFATPVTQITEGSTGDITLYAQWTPNTYTIQFDANEGTGEMEDQSFTYDAEPTSLSANIFERVGYNFNSWNTAQDGTGDRYNDKAEVQNLTAEAKGVVTLYAQWEEKQLINYRTLCTYNIEYTNLEGTTHTNPVTYTAADLPLIFTAPSAREGYTFAGWNLETLTAETRGDQEVEAQWTVNQYTVTWKLNGGQWQGGGTDDRVNNHNYGAEVTKPVDPSRTGYTFTGWSPAEIPETMPAENLEFTAQWTPTPYTVTWKLGGIEYATSTVSIENPLSTAPENPSDGELGCCADKFMGWSSQQSPSAGDIFTEDNIPSNVTTAKIYYAVFATTAQGVGTSIADFSEMGYENGTAVTDPIVLGDGEGHGDATITLEKAQSSSNAPTYYTDGEAVRIYAGGTITIASSYHIKNVAFTFAAGDGSNEITANSGTYADGVWTENVESPTNNLIITIGGEAGQHRRIASITVTTGVSGSQYTNYVTQCTTLPNPALSGGSVPAIAVNCGDFSALNNSQAINFSEMQDLTCPVTFEVIEGDFLISTAKDRAAQYQSKITVTPTKSGDNTGKLKKVYVRANATDHNENFIGNIKVTSDEITGAVIIDLTATVTCNKFTLTTVDHLGNETGFGTYFAGDVIETEPTPSSDACTVGYTFDGWSTAEVEYGSLIYNKVSFPYTMPAEDVTLYPVYQVNTTADYHRVTSDLGLGDVDGNNWAGDYLIAASYQIVADGSTSNLGTINGASIDENIVPASFGDRYYVSLIAVKGGYVLKTQENKNNEKPYVYITPAGTSTATNANLTTADNNPLSVTYNSESDILITNPQNTLGYALKFYSTKFGFYKAGSKIYLYRKSPLYTSSLICEEITVENAMVTSTAGQTVKVNVTATMSNTTVDRTRNLTVESDNADFTATINLTATENEYNVTVSYTPSVEDITDGTETANITIKVNNIPVTSFQVTGRSLPEIFAIVAKVGNVWYALPSQGLNSETTPVGFPVEVDNNDNPTTVTAVPANADWSLRQVYASSGSNDRFAANGENLVFINAENKTLYANNGNANIQTYAEYTNYAENNPDRYEWVPTTTDLTNYTLKNVGRDKDLSINVNATFGTHASNIASNNLRFLPINATYNPFDMQVVEWYPTKVLVQTEATLASVSATVGGVAVANPGVTKKGEKLYEISGLPLESNPTKILTISYDSYSCSKVIPIIISQNTKTVSDAPFSTLTKAIYNYSDLVVRDGAVLNITGAKNTPDKFVNVTIYPTAKIVVPENNQLSVYSLTFFGGIDDIYDGEKYTTNKYGVPQLSLKGTLGKTVTTMDYIMRVDLDQMYQVGVPYDVALSDITYGDGSPIELGTQLYVSAYDGQARANLDMNNTWTWEVNFAEKVLKAGIGYTISAEPQVEGDAYSILRMPMKNNIASGKTEESKQVPVIAYANQHSVQIADNHKGWNYLSNPYMTSISGGDADSKILLGALEYIDGSWELVNKEYRYVTIPYNDGEDYYQQKFSEATLLPFKSFFLQIAQDGYLSFALASRQAAPARYLQQAADSREVEFEILLANATRSDNMGLLISEEYTPDYEINADLEKMIGSMSVYSIYNGYNLAYNAINPTNAHDWIPIGYSVPDVGEYTFSLDEDVDLESVEHIYLIDYETSEMTDLVEYEYTFQTSEKKNDARFAIQVRLSQKHDNTTTVLDNLNATDNKSSKFIYNEQLYILRNGNIYDATGQFVTTINK